MGMDLSPNPLQRLRHQTDPRHALPMGQPAKPIDQELAPVLAAFDNAPMDDRLETEEERAAVEAAIAEERAGARMIPHAEVTAEIERWRISSGE